MRCAFEMLTFDTLPMNRKMLVLRSMLEALVVVNWNFMLTAPPNMPCLRHLAEEGRVKVSRVPSETWLDIPSIMTLGSGSPKDYACWLIAELRNQGEGDVFPHIKVIQREKGSVWEIKVRHGDEIVDPCKGMLETAAGS
jgi:hypothetical protein